MCIAGSCGGVRNWAQVTTTGAITARRSAALAYDSLRQKVVLFGGDNGVTSTLNDTWEYDPTARTWTQRTVTGPPARNAACMVFDPVRNVSVLFGGSAGSSTYLSDTWEWNGTGWTQRTPTPAPAARGFFACWWDPVRSTVAIYGGESASILSDVWDWNGTAWTQRTGLGTAPVRAVNSVAYDPVRARMVFFGGFNSGPQSGTWELGTTWSQPTVTGGPATARHGGAIGYDPSSGKVIMIGGVSNVNSSYVPQTGAWSYDGTAWTAITPDTGARGWITMVYDSNRARLISFGGFSTSSTAVATTWEY